MFGYNSIQKADVIASKQKTSAQNDGEPVRKLLSNSESFIFYSAAFAPFVCFTNVSHGESNSSPAIANQVTPLCKLIPEII